MSKNRISAKRKANHDYQVNRGIKKAKTLEETPEVKVVDSPKPVKKKGFISKIKDIFK